MTPVRWFPHYWSSLLPFATFAIYEGLKGDEGALGKYGRALSISLLGYLVFNTVLLTADLGFRRDSIRERKSLDEIARALRPFEGREDTIFGMGSWSIYFLYGSSLPISHSYYWDQYFGSFWDGLRPVSGDDLAGAFGKSLPTLWLVQDSEVSFTDTQVENAKTKLLKQYFRDDLYATVLKKDGWTLLRRLPVQPREQ